MVTPIEIPNELPIIVLTQAVLFPNALLPLHIFEERYRQMLETALDDSRIFGVAQALEEEEPSQPVSDLAEVMGIGVIRACVERPEGTSDLILQGLARVRIIGETQSEPFRTVKIEPVNTEIADPENARRLAESLRQASHALAEEGYEIPQKMEQYLEKVRDPEIIGDLMAAAFVADPDMRQEVLETEDLESRLEIVLQAMRQL
ncbi:MAG TPA: LON peptidase substrate-binding domain-containing protein [Chthoniobacterales bacterium]|jgi:Lon protease-like protein